MFIVNDNFFIYCRVGRFGSSTPKFGSNDRKSADVSHFEFGSKDLMAPFRQRSLPRGMSPGDMLLSALSYRDAHFEAETVVSNMFTN